MCAHSKFELNPYSSPLGKHESDKPREGTSRRLLTRLVASFLLAVAFGASIWALSPRLTGHQEPWDASFPLYLIVVFTAGGALAAICPRFYWVPVAGIYLGQVAFCLGCMTPNWWLVALMFASLAILGVPPAFAGAIGVFAIWRACRWAAARR